MNPWGTARKFPATTSILAAIVLICGPGSAIAGDPKGGFAGSCCEHNVLHNAWRSGSVQAPAGPVSELGDQELLMNADDYTRHFYFYGTAGVGRTNNVRLSEYRESDNYFWSTLDLIYRPRLHGNFYADLGLSYDVYRHDEYSSEDVDEQDVNIGLMRRLPRWGDAGLFAHYTYDRLVDGSDYDEIYTSHGVQAGIDKLFQVGAKSSIYARAFSRISLDNASPDFARRTTRSPVTLSASNTCSGRPNESVT